MKSYYTFLKQHFTPVYFGWLLTFFSSFGQTFLIALYVPAILSTFALSKSAFGGFYALATIAASFVLLRVGQQVDSQPLRPFVQRTVWILALATVLLGLALHPLMLLLALFGLRLAGQGLMSHISMTVMSRYFAAGRGKALSLAQMGYSMGEMFFPAGLGLLIYLLGWRSAALLSSLLVLLVLQPLLRRLPLESYDVPSAQQAQRFAWPDYWKLVSERNFWIIAPPNFVLSFLITGLFFYQLLLLEVRGWSLEFFALAFGLYAATRLATEILSGPLIDRFSARRLFPCFLLPMGLALLLLARWEHSYTLAVYLCLTGLSVGGGGTLKSAVLAEAYGTQNIGAVRSLFSMFMIFSTALAPWCFGILLDRGLSFEQVALGGAGLIGLCSLNSLRILKPLSPQPQVTPQQL